MTFVFDLDDTLYAERDYVRSGFRAVASLAGDRAEEAFRKLWSNFERGVRGNAFDLLLATFPHELSKYTVRDLVDLYRAHKPDIHLFPGLRSAFTLLNESNVTLALISDGPAESQEAKVRRLRLYDYFQTIVLTDSLGPDRRYWKPHPLAFEIVAINSGPFYYFADNPEKDFQVPLEYGWNCYMVRHKQQIHARSLTHFGHIPALSVRLMPQVIRRIVDEISRSSLTSRSTPE